MTNDPYKYFMIEAAELLGDLNRDILEFEKKPDNTDMLNRLFRYAHTLKGAAQVVGLVHISKLAHAIENLFSRTRDKKISLTAENISLIIETLDLISNIIESVKGENSEDAIDTTYILEKFEASDVPSQTADIKNRKPQTASQKPEPDNQPARQTPKPQQAETCPKIDSEIGPKTGNETIRISLADIDYLMDQASELITSTIRLDQLHTGLKNTAAVCHRLLTDCRKIKALINSAGAKPANQNQAYDELTRLSQKIDFESFYMNMLENTAVLDANTEELRQNSDSMYRIIHKARSMRVSDISYYFKGIARDLSVKLNKKLTFIVTGEELKFDRNLLQEIKEPLNQIIRNAAVHGIEDHEKRLSKGKNKEATIKLDFKKAGDFVIITCEDDGSGISMEKVKEAALKKGALGKKQGAEVGPADALQLIFASGISSSKIITEFAGRGVGLDIVKNKVESLRGLISVETEKDKFTRFIIKLPLSLNMIDAFLVESSGQQFLIPLNMVAKTGRVSQEEIESVAGKAVLTIDDAPVSLMWLGSILDLDNSHGVEQEKIPFLLLTSGHGIAAFAVDQILGTHKIIIKKLKDKLKNINLFVGGAVLSNGLPVLVLNVAELFKISKTIEGGFSEKTAEKETKTALIPRILTVDDSLTSRVLISGVLESKGYDVTLAVSGEDALNLIAQNKYDLFTLDVEMPGINGFELAEKIRKNFEHKDTPIIMLSSLAKDVHRRKGIQVGAQAYMVKGAFDQGIFLETVERLV